MLRALVVAVLTLSAAAAHAADNPLLKERWRSRPLVLAAPSPSDPSVQELARALSQPQTRAAFAERQIIVLTIVAGRGEMAGRTLRPEETRAVLATLGLHADGPATTLLIGKDGGVKLREANIHLDDIIAAIDAMPMRREEILHRQHR